MKKLASLKQALLRTALALSIALPVSTAAISGLNSAFAEGPADPAPFINAKVVNENAGKKVLFDNTHGQTAGAADWVIDGGFSDFGNALAGSGFDVKELRKTSPITYDDLKDNAVFVIGEANVPYKVSEQTAMLQYVQGGGSIFFIADHYNADRNKNRWDASEVFNGYRRGAWEDPAKGMSAEEKNSTAMQGVVSSEWLADNFGVKFRYNALGDITASDIVAPDQALGITAGVSNVAMHAGSTLAILDPDKAKGIVYLPQTSDAWPNAVDQGVYNGGGMAEGPYVAVSKAGAGKAAFIGDSSPVEDATPKYVREENGSAKTTYDGFKEQNDGTLLVNIVNWLANKENYTKLSDVSGLQLDQPTALLPTEVPGASTEPQPEPWSAPAAGYKWWDMSTFKAGSYGGSSVVSNPKYSVVHQSQLPNAQDFQIRVVADNLTPGSTLSNFQTGIYLTGGTQIGLFQNADGTWPTAYGYSTAFSLTADSKGHAAKTLSVRMKAGTSGAANLRFRQGSNNLITEAVTLANVPAEPLPPDGPVEPALAAIADARTKADGTAVTVEGVVTTEPGAFGGQAFYLQDETAGIYVFQSQNGFHQGDKVKVSASMAHFNSEQELEKPTSIVKTGTAALPAALAAVSVNDANQGQLIRLDKVTVKNIVSAAPTGSFEFDAVAGSVSNHVRVDGRTGLTLSTFPYKDGEQVNVVGVSAIFKGVFQLKPRGLADFALADTDAPVTTAVLSGATANEQGWYRQDVTVTLSATDAGTGVASIQYKLNGGEWTAFTSPIAINQEGTHTIEYYAVDAAGNRESTKSLQVKLDKTAPVSQATPSPEPNANGWYNQDVAVSISASDASGIAAIQAKLDAGTWTAYSSPIQVSGEGTHAVEYYAVDAAGNTEANQSLQVRIDRTAPAVVLLQSGVTVHDVVYTDSLQFTLAATDSLSGVEVQKLWLDGKDIQPGQALQAAQLGLGIHTIAYSVTDLAGNKADKGVTFNVGTSLATLHTLIAEFGKNGQFKSKNAQFILDGSIYAVEALYKKGYKDQAAKLLAEVSKGIDLGVGQKQISASAAVVLKEHIQYLLANGLK